MEIKQLGVRATTVSRERCDGILGGQELLCYSLIISEAKDEHESLIVRGESGCAAACGVRWDDGWSDILGSG
ncbi:hypothetical protein EYF80_004964 [Liparis tanakae]|uniref:Uncharacterized protein n=1 Tax=Liparis tanakae TaxID=230148 RepID=A0A4Z2J3X0_9TELE|nr:hypothetical protein EYF80_004964 [Liparis tanakae]